MSNETGAKSLTEDEEVARSTDKKETTTKTEEENKELTEEAKDAKDSDDSKDVTEKLKDKKETTPTKEGKENKTRSVSFNRDIHVKRFGKPRPSRGGSRDQSPTVRKEPFTNLSQEELIEEANRVRAQAQSVTCTADHPPEKFFSLPHRRKFKEKAERRNSDDTIPDKTPLGRSTSDVSGKKKKERTSLSTLFRRQQNNRNKSPDDAVKVSTKPIAIVKRSKSDVTDLKSNTTFSPQTKPIRKRSGSETEEFLKALSNKKSQLSPIIESSPREDYFKKTPPLEVFEKQKLSQKDSVKSDTSKSDAKKVNPVEKPPRYSTPLKSEPKAPVRIKRGKSLSPPIADTPKRKTEIKKTLLVDEIDTSSSKIVNPIEVKDKIKESIRKIEENVYADTSMIHSSQRPPDKPPLTRGHTVDHMVRILKEDQMAPPKSHILTSQNSTSINQPFSYIKPSVSPDANIFVRNTPDRIPSPVNKMTDKGVVYAEVIRDGDRRPEYKKYSPTREKYGPPSDEDEGLGYEERYKYTSNRDYDYEYKNKESENYKIDGYKVTDSPIRPRFREYRLTSFDELEPTYANEYPSPKEEPHDYIDTFRGRGDGMDTKKKSYEPETTKIDLDFNELSHRRQLLESRLNARRLDRDRVAVDEPITRYLTETDPIYEAEKRMKATERYVNETVKYYRNTLERDGYTESSVTEDYNKYDSENQKIKYNTESRTFQKVSKDELDRRNYINRLEPRYKDKSKEFPPEPEYEPPSLESNPAKPVLTPDEYKEKKYKAKRTLTSSHDALQTGQKYKVRDDFIDKRKGHYASNPEIAQEREEDYANLPTKYSESYHNSLRRMKNKDKHKAKYGIKRHDSGDSRDYYERSPSRFDNRLVDSGIENDFRKDSSGEIHMRHRRYESDDDANNVALFLDIERRHTEDNYPGEQIYANTEYMKHRTYREDGHKKEYNSRERSADDGSRFDPKLERYEKSPSRIDEKVSAKPPKAKKLSGLEKVKQLFSRDSSKKSKKEKEVQPQTRTRVLKSPEHLAGDDSDYRRYTDPEPSDIVVRKINYDCQGDERRIRGSRENLERYRDPEDRFNSPDDRYRNKDDRYNNSPENRYKNSVDRYTTSPEDRYKSPDDGYRSPDNRDSDIERKYREYDQRVENRYADRVVKEEHRYKERREEKRYNSSERESDTRPSDGESELRTRRAAPDSPALAERYRGRRRLATPSPTPSPPRRPAPAGWFKSLDRLTRKKKTGSSSKVDKDSVITVDGDPRQARAKKPLNSPAKNLRFFGDTDADSDAISHSTVVKSKSHPAGTLRKTISNSSNGLDEVDAGLMSSKSYSLSNLHRTDQTRVEDRQSPRNLPNKYYKGNLQNISEIQSNSETESQLERKMHPKPPINPYDRSRSHSSSKTLKAERKSVESSIDTRRKEERGSTDNRRRAGDRGSATDVRRRVEDRGSSTDLRRKTEDRGRSTDIRRRTDERGSSSELRSSKQELNRDLKARRRTPAGTSGESSTEGDSSHQSQRSVVYLHATTVGDIPDPGRMLRNRSRDDVSSVNSSSIQLRTTTKSFSIFAPWTPKHYSDQHEVHYAQKPRKTKRELAKTGSATLQKNKSYSQSTLTRKPANTRLTSSSQTLYRKPERKEGTLRKSVTRDGKKSQSSEIISRERDDRERLSRSVSMPKNNDKKAGWFKLSSKKKPEVNTRVR